MKKIAAEKIRRKKFSERTLREKMEFNLFSYFILKLCWKRLNYFKSCSQFYHFISMQEHKKNIRSMKKHWI